LPGAAILGISGLDKIKSYSPIALIKGFMAGKKERCAKVVECGKELLLIESK
jgi:hypothetical protein